MKQLLFSVALVGATAVASASSAATTEYSGVFTDPSEVFYFDIEIDEASFFEAETLSSAGGTSILGTTVDTGGFDPMLWLFDSEWNLITQNDDAHHEGTGFSLDSYIGIDLAAGSYALALTRFYNVPVSYHGDEDGPIDGPIDGPVDSELPTAFSLMSSSTAPTPPSWTCGQGGCGSTFYNDPSFFVQISTTPSVPAVPLPASLPLLLAGLGGFGLIRRKRG